MVHPILNIKVENKKLRFLISSNFLVFQQPQNQNLIFADSYIFILPIFRKQLNKFWILSRAALLC